MRTAKPDRIPNIGGMQKIDKKIVQMYVRHNGKFYIVKMFYNINIYNIYNYWLFFGNEIVTVSFVDQ